MTTKTLLSRSVALHLFAQASLVVTSCFPIMLCIQSCGDSGTSTHRDASVDAYVPVDNDGDQYPSNVDCDDNDDQVYPGVLRNCQSDCNYGVEVCQEDGLWSACTADANCDCSQPGDFREVDCGNCGWAYQECGSDFQWQYPGECFDEGECAPGHEEQEGCANCGTRTRICNPDCTWRPWSTCENQGECHPGVLDWTTEGCANLGEVQQRECTDQCDWQVVTTCTADCLIPPRSGLTNWSDEVCIGGGPFIMGSDNGAPDEAPKHTVYLSAYLIDVYEVTNNRYRQCVQAGTCNPPTDPYSYDWAGYGGHPITGITWDDAMTFCAWDGGRTLPTEAQWEKAARGPAPREVTYTWGDTPEPSCQYVNGDGCEGTFYSSCPVDGYEAGISFYGAYNMLGNAEEWCQDFYSASYYGTSPQVDPTGPTSGTERVIRGGGFTHQFPPNSPMGFRIANRYSWTPASSSYLTGFRCARQAY